VQLIEVIVAQFTVFGAITQNAESDQERPVSRGNERLAKYPVCPLCGKRRAQVAVLFAGGSEPFCCAVGHHQFIHLQKAAQRKYCAAS